MYLNGLGIAVLHIQYCQTRRRNRHGKFGGVRDGWGDLSAEAHSSYESDAVVGIDQAKGKWPWSFRSAGAYVRNAKMIQQEMLMEKKQRSANEKAMNEQRTKYIKAQKEEAKRPELAADILDR